MGHFSFWSFGKGNKDIAFLKGRVIDRSGRGIAGVPVKADQGVAITDANGYYKAEVPADKEFKVELNYKGFKISLASSPIAAGQTGSMDLSVPPMTYIKGNIVGCDSKGSPGQVNLSWGEPEFSQVYTKDGKFELSLPTMVVKSTLTISANNTKLKKDIDNKNKSTQINRN